MIKVTPLSIGGNSGSAAYIRVDGAGKLTHMQKREIEFRVNNHDRLTEENAKLREALSAMVIHYDRYNANLENISKLNDIASSAKQLLNQPKEQGE